MGFSFLVLYRDAKRCVRLWGLGGRREPDQDTLSLRVARSGTNLPAPVAIPRQAVVCRPCLEAKYRRLPKVLVRFPPSSQSYDTFVRRFAVYH